MFQNIGTKIKNLAKIECWVGIIFSIGLGIYFIVQGIVGQGLMDSVLFSFMLGIFTMFFGSLLSWLSCMLLLGFGELIESNEQIRTLLQQDSLNKEKFYE